MMTPRLRETVTLEKPVESVPQTDWGAPDGTEYETVGSRRAQVEEDAGSIDRRAGRDEPTQRMKVKMRSWDAVDTTARFRWNGQVLWVAGVKALDQERRWIEVSTFIDPDA